MHPDLKLVRDALENARDYFEKLDDSRSFDYQEALAHLDAIENAPTESVVSGRSGAEMEIDQNAFNKAFSRAFQNGEPVECASNVLRLQLCSFVTEYITQTAVPARAAIAHKLEYQFPQVSLTDLSALLDFFIPYLRHTEQKSGVVHETREQLIIRAKNRLKEDKFYQSTTHGEVQFKGWDTYMGETTAEFSSITYRKTAWIKPQALPEFLGMAASNGIEVAEG
jgi:hypothetical protein